MYDPNEDSNLETDHLEADYSQVKSRVDSFRGSSLAQQLSAERLARAGFYFTGNSDCVRCFSCQKTVENWNNEDTPVERHKEVSPSCNFLNCVYRTSFNRDYGSSLINGSTYNEEAEDRDFRIRTGEVVDECTYPLLTHMRSEEARLQTFSSWPPYAPVTPRDLAQAGFHYLGQQDSVECFCCRGRLSGWEPGDTAWGEHTNHYPNCLFILGHDVGNIPLQGGTEEESESRHQCNTHSSMESFEERLQSFANVLHPIDHERLATAGFYSTGEGDKVLCFCCGGGLKGWQPGEDPWEEHAKYYPGCNFLIAKKGLEFINTIQLQYPQRNRPTSSHQNGFSGNGKEVLCSAMAQEAIRMGLEPSVVEKTVLEKISRTGSPYSTLEALLNDCFNNTESSAAKKDEDPMEKLLQLQREKLCKICLDRDYCVVFIPCAHLATCEECSKPLEKCPICCGVITQKVKTYIS